MGDTVPINGVITGPALVSLDPARAGDARLGRGARQGRPARTRCRTAIASSSLESAVHRRAGRGRQDRVSGTAARAGPTAAPSCSPRTTARHATTRTWVLERQLERAAQAVGPQAAGRVRAIRASRCSVRARATILQAGDSIYLSGAGASPEGDRPFLDRLNLKTLADRAPVPQRRRRATKPSSACWTTTATQVLTRYETRTQPPNYFVRDLHGTDQNRR